MTIEESLLDPDPSTATWEWHPRFLQVATVLATRSVRLLIFRRRAIDYREDTGLRSHEAHVRHGGLAVVIHRRAAAHGMAIEGLHIGELRRAVDEVRRAAGQSPAWSSYAPATGLVSFADVSTLRSSLDAACSTIRGTACSYTGPAPAVNGPVLAVQVQSIRDAVK